MGMVSSGITHCEKCMKPLKDNEYVLCEICKKDKEIEKLKKHNKDLLRKLRNRVKEVKKLNKYSLYKKELKTLNEQLKIKIK